MCRKVQVLRPRTSTSGGQSSGSVACVPVRVVEGGALFVSFLVMAAQEAKEVQERQLYPGIVSTCSRAYISAGNYIRAGHTVSHRDPVLRPLV